MKKTLFASLILLSTVMGAPHASAQNADWIDLGPDFDRAVLAAGFTGISSLHSMFTLSGTIFGVQQLGVERPLYAPAIGSIAAGAVELALIAPVWASTDDGVLLGVSAVNAGLAIASTTIGIVNVSRRMRYDARLARDVEMRRASFVPMLHVEQEGMRVGFALRY